MPITKPYLEVTLEDSYNLYYLSIGDISDYPTAWTITNPTIEVTPPGFSKVSAVFTPKSKNFYKSSQLGITCEDDDCVPIPDGVYTIKYSVYPNSTYNVEKSFMRVDNLRCQYGKAFLKIDQSCGCGDKEKYRDKQLLASALMMMEGAIASVNNCDTLSANKYYNKAKQVLDNITKSGCGCN